MYAFHARELLNANSNDKTETLDELKKKLRSKFPSKDEFIANFSELYYTTEYTKEKQLVKYVLTKYDSYYSKKDKTGLATDYDLMTIEHIQAENDLSESVNEEFIGMIGNLLLIDENLNGKLGNKDFKKKHAEYVKSKIYLDEIIKTGGDWGEAQINNRTDFIGKKLYEEVFKF